MTTLSIFRKVALAEGISFVFLVFIAMPLKYWADMPLFVKYGGWAHGLLFVLYIIFLIMAWQEYAWKFTKVLLFGLASLIPLAPFWVEKKLGEENSNNSL
ncbi:DUF3817 domain-containing protein [Pedobacter sp. BAL39]|uniref:DUF3817 domain-containing protein n=1 Tax=Pedobacter sp. BAL39 TaxID=391596 RepID=UPI0002F6C837|nr:DUF3817 domain-containing protein [Pedobacter sp. BAL39]